MTRVYTMLGRDHLDCSICCLRSFLYHCKDDVALQIISDGSLDAEQQNVLRQSLGADLVDQSVIEAPKRALLSAYPALREVYNSHVVFRKLVDGPLLAGAMYRFIDSDILFFRDFRGLFSNSIDEYIFAEDVAVTMGIRDMLRLRRPIHCDLNCGIIQSRGVNYEDIARFYAGMVDTKNWVREQAGWIAGIPGKLIKLVSLQQVMIERRWSSPQCFKIRNSHVAVHLTGYRKASFRDYCVTLGRWSSRGRDEVISIEHKSCARSSVLLAVLSKIRRRLLRIA